MLNGPSEAKGIAACIDKVLARYEGKRIVSPSGEGTTMDEDDVLARDIVATVLARDLEHRIMTSSSRG